MFEALRQKLATLWKRDEGVQIPPGDEFLRSCRGVLHIGANFGQERGLYASLGLPVVWVEALPDVYRELQTNIAPYGNQKAILALLTDRDGQKYNFRVANNGGASSSILELKYHKDIWPEVEYVAEIEMESTTLGRMLAENGVDIARYNGLVMDTQGSELMILKGAGDIVGRFDFIKTEAADFEAYENCATVDSLCAFLEPQGFRLTRRDKFAQHPSLGAYYDILFERSPAAN